MAKPRHQLLSARQSCTASSASERGPGRPGVRLPHYFLGTVASGQPWPSSRQQARGNVSGAVGGQYAAGTVTCPRAADRDIDSSSWSRGPRWWHGVRAQVTDGRVRCPRCPVHRNPSGPRRERGAADRSCAIREARHTRRGAQIAVVRGVPHAVVSLDQTGTIHDWNPGACAIFGWSADEAIGRSFWEIALPARYADLRGLLQTGNDGPPARRDVAGQRRDGTEFPAVMSMAPVWLPGRGCSARSRGRTSAPPRDRAASSQSWSCRVSRPYGSRESTRLPVNRVPRGVSATTFGG